MSGFFMKSDKIKEYYSGPHWHPEIKDLLNEFKYLSERAHSNHNLIQSSYIENETHEESLIRRNKALGAGNAYDYIIERLRELNDKI